MTLIKLNSTPWVNRIGDALKCGLNIQEDDDQSLPASTMSPSSQLETKKRPAPLPSTY